MKTAADENDVEDVKCPECGYFTTSEELNWIIKENGEIVECSCPECGHQFDIK